MGGLKKDILVIGGGHNGLALAALLAKAQKQVMVLERRPVLGGAATTEEIFPSVRVPTGGLDVGALLPQLVRELNLPGFGLRFLEGPALNFLPLGGGRSLTIWRDPRRTAAEIATFSAVDGRRFPEYAHRISRLAGVLGEMMALTPPSLPGLQLSDLRAWLKPALAARRLGAADLMAFLRTLPMPLCDWLDEWFENLAVKAALGAPAVIGSMQGPRASGTAFMLLYRAIFAEKSGVLSGRYVQGGPGALSQALAQAAEAHGAEICTGLAVEKILVDGDRAVGVRLFDGREIAAEVIVSSLDPRRTFLELVGAQYLPVGFVRDLRSLRMQASVARVNLALDNLPKFSGADGGDRRERFSGRLSFSGDLDDLERAYDHAKYGRFPPRPHLEAVIPTVLDPGLAPKGHLMCVNVQYTPYLRAADGAPDLEANVDLRQRLPEIVIHILSEYSPDLPGLVTAAHAMTPQDLEREYGLTGGDIYHGQMGLDQLLFMRPVAGYGRYAAPIKNLYLCGAGTHPGGGLTGAPGYNAAREILRRG